MKKFVKQTAMVIGVIALVAVIGTMTACSRKEGGSSGGGRAVNNGSDPAYFGTWKYTNNREGNSLQERVITISANSISVDMFWSGLQGKFLMEDLTWLPVNNSHSSGVANFPTGFEVRGTVKENRYLNEDREGVRMNRDWGNEGEDGKIFIFLHNNKSSLGYSGSNNSSFDGTTAIRIHDKQN